MNPTAKHVKDTLLAAGPNQVLEAFQSIARMRSLTPDKNGSDWSEVLTLLNPPKPEIPTSRSARFDVANSIVGNAKGDVESLRDELQEWLDNMPENKQNGSKADELSDAISSLEEFIDACETAESVSVEFPGMFG